MGHGHGHDHAAPVDVEDRAAGAALWIGFAAAVRGNHPRQSRGRAHVKIAGNRISK
jgi:hypothetical protein